MTKSLTVSQSHTVPVPPAEAFAFTLPVPLESIFSKRYWLLPPVTKTTQDGVWGTVGQTRTVHTSDGGKMREELLQIDSPNVFSYELTEVEGPLKPMVTTIDGSWSFEPAGTGTRVTWAWTIHPKGRSSAVVFPVLGRLWKGYAARALQRLEDLMLAK